MGVNDLLAEQAEQSSLQKKIDLTAVEMMTMLEKAHGGSSTTDQTTLNFLATAWDFVEIGEGKHRRVAIVDPLLELLLIALTFQIAPKIESSRVPISERRVFSYRWIGDEVGFNPKVGWGAFEQAELASLSSSQYIAEIDISLFYESISEQLVEMSLHKIGVEREDVRCMMTLLSHLRVSEFGLPVGGHFSRILAEACLCASDWALIESGVHFIRFVDDYRIFADDIASLRRHILKITQTLGGLGLSINKGKLRTFKSSELLETRLLTTDMSIENQYGAEPLIVRHHFDPYSQLVGHRVDELKAISNSENLSQTLVYELDKIEPNYRSLKFIFAAIKFATPSEQLDCLTMIYQNLERQILNRLSLPILNLTSTLIDSIDEKHRVKLAGMLWDYLKAEFEQCAAGTLCHWIRALNTLGVDTSTRQQWRLMVISSLDTPILLRREVLQWELSLQSRSSELPVLLSSLKETLSEGDFGWINSLLFAMESKEELERMEDPSASICHLLARLT